jgi:hypothetical protein
MLENCFDHINMLCFFREILKLQKKGSIDIYMQGVEKERGKKIVRPVIFYMICELDMILIQN